MKKILRYLRSSLGYLYVCFKWVILAALVGCVVGPFGAMFGLALNKATALRTADPRLIYLLPLGGLVIVFLYQHFDPDGGGSTNQIFVAVREHKPLSLRTAPLIFVTTVITHLFGGSSGREGAALLLGGSLSGQIGRRLQLEARDCRLMTMCGMAAGFAALFGTPLAATVFAIMVISIGVIYHVALYPSLLAALVAYGVSVRLGVEPTRFTVAVPDQSVGMFVRVAALGVLCALVSILFCKLMHGAGHLMKRIKNPWLRVICGGFAVIALTWIFGTDYNGAGMDVVTRAIEQETVAVPWAFLLKLVFTAVTLAAGFKGGEVVPSFFVGATFGCAVSPLLGLPVGFGAAVGLAAVFCGVTNCPVASTLLAVELFGAEGMLYFALACCLSYMLSGYQGLYSSQTILYSKLKAQFINVHTNAYHAGEKTE